MSWDCPHWNNDICQLNGITCKPGKGQCVPKGRFEIKSGNVGKEERKEKKEDSGEEKENR